MRTTTGGGVAALAITLAVAAAPAGAAEKIVWDWAVYGPPRAVSAPVEYVAKYVAEKSGGNFTFNIHYAEAISPAKAALDGLKIDAFQGALVAFSYAPGKTPLHLALDLPYLPIPNLEVAAKVQETFYEWEPAKKELARWNAWVLYPALLPQYEFMGTGKTPKTLDDWKGMRVRALGPLGDAMRTIGAVPTSVPAPEVYNGLERGTFQAAAFPFAYSFGTYRLHEVSKWYTYGMQPGIVNNGWTVSKTAYDKLPAEYKKILEDARPGQYAAVKAAYKAEDEKWVPIYDKTLERLTFTPELLKQFVDKAGKPVWDKWIADTKAKGLPAQEALDLILATATKVSGS